MSVKPEKEAVCAPFIKSSLSSKPGSPKQTLVSIHPDDTCKSLNEIIFLALELISLLIS